MDEQAKALSAYRLEKKEQFNDATRFIAIIKDYLAKVQNDEK